MNVKSFSRRAAIWKQSPRPEIEVRFYPYADHITPYARSTCGSLSDICKVFARPCAPGLRPRRQTVRKKNFDVQTGLPGLLGNSELRSSDLASSPWPQADLSAQGEAIT